VALQVGVLEDPVRERLVERRRHREHMGLVRLADRPEGAWHPHPVALDRRRPPARRGLPAGSRGTDCPPPRRAISAFATILVARATQGHTRLVI